MGSAGARHPGLPGTGRWFVTVGMEPRPVRLLALGDSYTIGEGVGEEESWPWLVVSRLREEGIESADPEIIAKTGWTTSDLERGIEEIAPAGPFHVVTLLVGVNNQYQDLPLDDYGSQFAELLRRATEFSAGEAARAIVISVPDWGAMPHADGRDRFAIGGEIDAFNATARYLATNAGSPFVDVTDLSRLALGRPELVADDGLHPSAAMYELWVDRILPAVRDAVT